MMENYLQYMKILRSQMNDVEDQAAMISVEEQTQITTIHTLEKDLDSAKLETKQIREDADEMIKAKGRICSQILGKQRKSASLESDSSTLAQTLELMQQERVSLFSKLTEKSAYYTKIADEINSKLQQQQEWFNSQVFSRGIKEHELAKDGVNMQTAETEDSAIRDFHNLNNLGNDPGKNLVVKLDSAKAKLDEIARLKSELLTENIKMKQSIEEVKHRGEKYKHEMLTMDIKTLEEEYKALLSDKAGESEYLQSVRDQIGKLKGISHVIKCACGMEYEVEMGSLNVM